MGRSDRRPRETKEDAEAVALQALAFLLDDPDSRDRFVALSGVTADDLRQRLADPHVLAAILDHLLQDEALLLAFCAAGGLDREKPLRVRRLLPGAGNDGDLG